MGNWLDPEFTEGYLVHETEYLDDEVVATRYVGPNNTLFYKSLDAIERYVGIGETHAYHNSAGKHHKVRKVLKAKLIVEELPPEN